MTDNNLGDALHQWNADHLTSPPAFDSIRHHVTTRSPLDVPRWSPAKSIRLAAALVRAQCRIVPWQIYPVSLAVAVLAVVIARALSADGDASTAISGFCSLLLSGVTVTVSLALTPEREDAVAVATPLGPETVVAARLALVLAVDAAVGVVASVAVALVDPGAGIGIPQVLAGWLVPLAVVAGAVTVVSVWSIPWVGALIGLVLTPLASPGMSETPWFIMGSVSGVLWNQLTPAGLLGVGAVLLFLAVVSARRATQWHPASARAQV
ncbi:hypothetical protein [Corynebacterium nuruki]|uniref:hypothetical protein n=1 Tax=Corynebacterium nuruki TaxID=1032851 RepID=UPI0039BF7B77